MSDKASIELEIQQALGDAIQYDLERMFPKRKGFGARRRVRAKLKLLKELAPSLATALMEGEKLIYVARGYLIHWWEQFFAGGLVAYYVNITCVVLTDRRILLINSNSAGKQKHFRNQILYTEVAKVKMRSFFSSASKLKLKDGKSLTIGGFKGADRKHMQSYVPELVASMPDGAPRVQKSVQYLCPHCPAIYTELQAQCAKCGTTFKSAKKAALMSLFLPGLGDIYLGHTAFGLLELLGSLIEWVILITAIATVAAGDEGGLVFLATWIVIMAFTNVTDYALTRAMGRKGLIAAARPGKA